MEISEASFFSLQADSIMSKSPKRINLNEKLVVASEFMSRLKISSLLVEDDAKNFVGIVQMYDLDI